MTVEQKQEALRLYEAEGPSAASRLTGIPKSTLATSAREAGMRTFGAEKTAAATQMRRRQGELNRELIKERLEERILDALDHMEERSQPT